MIIVLTILNATLGAIQDTDTISIGGDTAWVGERYPILINGQESGFYLSNYAGKSNRHY